MLKVLKRLWALGILSFMLTGCSLVAVSGPPPVDPSGRLPPRATCTSDPSLPTVDLVGAGVVGGFAVSVFVRHGSESSDGWSAVVWSGALGLSGILGLRRVRACQAARGGSPVPGDTVRADSMLAPIRVPDYGRRLFDLGEEWEDGTDLPRPYERQEPLGRESVDWLGRRDSDA